MRSKLLVAAVAVVGAIWFDACTSSALCDANDNFNPASKAGDCEGLSLPAKVLTPSGSCSNALDACSDSEITTLESVVDCWEKLPVCSAADAAGFQSQADACYAKASGVAQGCKDAFFGGKIPGTNPDGGTEEVDAGYPPDTTDAGALDLIVVADETRMALAWTASQPGPVAKWQINGSNAADVKSDPVFVTPPKTMYWTTEVGSGLKMKYYVLGVDSNDEVVTGEPDAGVIPDAGTGCTNNLECSADTVCNIASGMCEEQACTNSDVCAAGYLCDGTKCLRTNVVDAGTDAGTGEMDADSVPRPFVSELAEAQTGAATFSANRVVSSFTAKNVDMVALDSARQFMVAEQEGSIFGHTTRNRGKSFVSTIIDPSGRSPKVAYEPKSGTTFVCYNAFGAIRVRASLNGGQSFREGAVDLAAAEPDDGGTAPAVKDCAIAPWQEGTVLVAGIQEDTVRLWTVTDTLEIQGDAAGSVVFASSEDLFSPDDVAIATLPENFTVHVLFAAMRRVTTPMGTTTDYEVLAAYRDPTTSSAFVGPLNVNIPNGFDQRKPSVVIDPVTKRAVAAFLANESPAGGGMRRDTIYISFWNQNQATQKWAWATGSDLNVFIENSTKTAFHNFPGGDVTELWVARAPSLAVSPEGRVFLSFLAAPYDNNNPVLVPWLLEFGFNAENKVIGQGVKGWFVPPAIKVADQRVAYTKDEYFGPVLVTDPQISWYLGFVEGIGANGEVPNRPVIISRPK